MDEVRNRADLRAYLAHVARRYVSLEITTVDLEATLEREFKLAPASLQGKLVQLEVLIAQSKSIYQAAALKLAGEKAYGDICEVSGIEPQVVSRQLRAWSPCMQMRK